MEEKKDWTVAVTFTKNPVNRQGAQDFLAYMAAIVKQSNVRDTEVTVALPKEMEIPALPATAKRTYNKIPRSTEDTHPKLQATLEALDKAGGDVRMAASMSGLCLDNFRGRLYQYKLKGYVKRIGIDHWVRVT